MSAVFRATTRSNKTLSAVFCKSLHQFPARANPGPILWSFPKLAGYGVPSEVKQEFRAQSPKERGGCTRSQQVALVPRNIVKERVTMRKPGHSMDFVTSLQKQRETMTAEKTSGTGNQNSFHGQKSGNDRSRSERMASFIGQSMPNKASSQRTPLAHSG